MMSVGGSLQFSHESSTFKNYTHISRSKLFEIKDRSHLLRISLSSCVVQQDHWSLHVSDKIYRPLYYIPYRYNAFRCRSFALSTSASAGPIMKSAALALTRSYNALHGCPLLLQLVPAVGLIAFAVWGLGPLMRHTRVLFLSRNDANWKKSRTHYVFTSYLQPLLLWTGAILICRVLDPVALPSEASQAVKQRLLNFVRSFSTVLAFAYCLSSLIQQTQKFFMETNQLNDARNMGFQFAGRAVYTAVWIAAVSLFIELLGFSTQKWLTAGGFGTVLLTLAGREIFTNFLSSIMIHATRPFVLNEWIQTKIEGYEVSGTVEHVGWWSPTIIRGDDREAVHIPNHKFTVNVVRNLSQKTHWRVKTHFAISHLDANKISNIVADMRKVLAKNPQVEQQRLHRRVFLEYIDPENQAFMILISCFVKTSRFEEFLCVKETILLDLLRVITHHRARLATPIRTVQKIYGDYDLENVPFSETVIARAGASINRPLFLIETTSRINGDDKTRGRSTPRTNEESPSKTDQSLVSNDVDDIQQKVKPPPFSSSTKSQREGLDSTGLNSKDARVLEASFEKPPANLSELASDRGDGTPATAQVKQESEKPPVTPPPVTRPSLENIVLGVALDGSKRTLPIEEGMGPSSAMESKELAARRKGSGSAAVPGGTSSSEQHEQEK